MEFDKMVKDYEAMSEDTLYLEFRNLRRRIAFTGVNTEEYRRIIGKYNALCEAFKNKTGKGILEDD